ncbi:GntR family transcriptional regulator [Lederbergia sp. NSJ-179]|uniref:GntR family transcriptional regulator n=1 Tax=Lederbergia sp. NSJ-179 TaxID=2931402 RepID=UPI001FD3C226|nr:GntR family transcriptional regulator [Lederbergia sp. NSJ-179]MCJ7841326.1 GntR family transcriptional regulator [Lederbergia sp. NSJ-179]
MTKLRTRVNGSTRDYVYETIKKQIINGELEPETKISENEIATKLNVSRTPVREAFLKLAEEGLLGIYPQSGTFVAKIDLELVEEGRFIRENIEKAIVREACGTFDQDQLIELEKNLVMQELCLEKGSTSSLFELDEAFHQLLFEGCNKIYSLKIIREMNSHFDRVRMLSLASNHNWDVILSQHKAIFQYISENEPDLAEEVMAQHLKLVNFEKEELKSRYPGYFK